LQIVDCGLRIEKTGLRGFQIEEETGFGWMKFARHDGLIRNLQSEIRNPADLAGVLQQIPRILLIRLRSLGDSILTLPLIESLHKWRPDLALDVLSETPYAPVFLHHPAVHETLIVRSRNHSSGGWNRLRALLEIRRRQYGAVLNLHGGTTSLLFTLASGAQLRIGHASYRAAWAYNVRIPPAAEVWQRSRLHTVEHQLTLLRWLGLPIPDKPRSSLWIDPLAQDRVLDRLRSSGISPDHYILIAPTATLFTKQWDEGKFAQLGDQLEQRYGLPVVFTGAPHETLTLRKIAQGASRSHFYWSDLDAAGLFALIQNCRLFVGNDGGATHAAAALMKPVVVVWGSSNFVAWHPWGTDYELVRSDLPCMPCPGYTCEAFGEPKCILEISVERVFEACERILDRRRTSHPKDAKTPRVLP
jgi:ADP-heptose:LPS heptosyltransferase